MREIDIFLKFNQLKMRCSMIANDHTYVLITAAGSSIGRALAKVFAEDGYWLILTDGHGGDLREIENEIKSRYPMISVTSNYKDLTKKNAACELYYEVYESDK